MASDGKLVFIRPSDGSGRLVFNDDADVVIPVAEISVDADIDGDADCTVQLLWSANVSRGQAVELRTLWQLGDSAAARAGSLWQDAQQASARAGARWQLGGQAGARIASGFQLGAALGARAGSRWQDGAPLHQVVQSDFQWGVRRHSGLGVRWHGGTPLRQVVQSDFQWGVRRRTVAALRWQDGPRVFARLIHEGGAGIPVRSALSQRWQQARRPLAGITGLQPPVDPGEEPCYDPATLGRLEFTEAWAPDGRLVFVCHAGEQPAAGVVIPVRRSYVVHNSVTLYRLPSGAEFEAKSFSLDLDADSWTFGWSASLHSSAAAHMTRSPSGERVEVECVVNGVHLRLVVDGKGPDRRFPEHRIQVRGRGRAAELADPSLTFGNTAARTAQQLMADVLTVNGVSMGWGIDWQIEDWLVPAGAWVFSGSYIDALRDIAGAAGAYLQPHLTDQVIRVLPRYPLAPWHWANLAVGVELPVEATSVEGIEEVIRPNYNQVHLGGLKAPAVFGPFKRTGTAGDKEAPQVNHALITAAEVHRQRGRAILSDTGLQEHVSISTMLWPETGIIMPGTVLRYVSDDGPRTGIVRKTGLSMQQWPQLVQTLGVETHVE